MSLRDPCAPWNISDSSLHNILSENAEIIFKMATKRKDWSLAESILKSGRMTKNLSYDTHELLIIVVKRGYKDMCEELIKRGADVNYKTKDIQLTPLHIACLNGYVDICKLLISSGASLIEKDLYGRTATLFAARSIGTTLVDQGISTGYYSLSPGKRQGMYPRADKPKDYFVTYRNPPHDDKVRPFTINGTLDAISLVKKEIEARSTQLFTTLLCERTFSSGSPFHKDYLPLDMFKLILKMADVRFELPPRANNGSWFTSKCNIF